MDVFVFLLGILLVLWLVWRKQKLSKFKKLGIPGPEPHIIFGNLLELYWKGPLQCHKEWVEKYGRVLGYYYGMKRVLLVTDRHIIKHIFIKDFQKFTNRETFNPIAKYEPHDKYAQSIVSLPGQAWKDVRSILTPTFTTVKMKQMTAIMNSSIDAMIGKIEEKAKRRKDVEVLDVFQRLTLDVITRTAFGIRTDVQTNPNSKVLHATNVFLHTPYNNKLIFIALSCPLLRCLCLKVFALISTLNNYGSNPQKILRAIMLQVVEYRRKNPQSYKSDLLQLMIDSSITPENTEVDISKLGTDDTNKRIRAMSDHEIISTACSVLLAGYDTTSTALAFTTYLLAKHQDIQEILFQEIRQLMQSGQELEYATVNKLPYLDKVICESMRIYPPVTFFANRYALEDVQYGDLKIPKGTLILAPIYLMHHDPEFWTDPETFDPERFNDKPNSDGITYLPFGVGPRSCLGMRLAQLEIKLALAHTIYKFHVRLAEKKEDIQLSVRIRTLAPENGVVVRLECRNVDA